MHKICMISKSDKPNDPHNIKDHNHKALQELEWKVWHWSGQISGEANQSKKSLSMISGGIYKETSQHLSLWVFFFQKQFAIFLF